MTTKTLQFDHDVTEIVDAYAAGGNRLAQPTYAAICLARGLTLWECHILSQTSHEAIMERNRQ